MGIILLKTITMMKSLYVSLLICLLIAVGTESRRKFGAGGHRRLSINCPDGVRVHRCFLNPCMLTTCVDPPYLQCSPNYCGGCNAHFYDPVSNERVECVETGSPTWSVYGQRSRHRSRPRPRPGYFRRDLK